MSDYTPTTAEVIKAYSASNFDGMPTVARTEAALRWLASVKAEAWNEGFTKISSVHGCELCDYTPNPYREEVRNADL